MQGARADFSSLPCDSYAVALHRKPFDVGWSDSNIIIRQVQRMVEKPRLLSPVQRFNHLLGNQHLHRKDLLASNANKLQAMCPERFNFHPTTFVIPGDLDAMERHTLRNPGSYWVLKPSSGMQGHGIILTKNPVECVHKSTCKSFVVQEYLANPLVRK